jgi:hypothetical protein
MHTLRSFRIGLIVCACLSLFGCGSDGTAPDAPAKLVPVAGNGQVAKRGSAAPEALRVRVVGATDKPVAGVTVQWTVTEGQATLDRRESVTDASGETETHLTVVGVVGTILVRATVPGVPPITFGIAGTDPCQTADLISVESAVTGGLDPLDCDLGSESRWDLYRVEVETQKAIEISLESSFFGGIQLFGYFDGAFKGQSLYRSGEVNPAIVLRAIVPAGTYIVGVTGQDPGATGSYTLRARERSANAEGCELIWILAGATTTQHLASTDCHDTSGLHYHDLFFVGLSRGQKVTVTHSSSEFSPLLLRRGWTGDTISLVDGSATGSAALDFTADVVGPYVIDASSVEEQRSGDYTISVSEASPRTASRGVHPESATASALYALPDVSPRSFTSLPRAEIPRAWRRR